MSKVVFLVAWDHKHGMDYAVATSQAGAMAIAANWIFAAVVSDDDYDGDQPRLVELCKRQNACVDDGPLDGEVIDMYLAIEQESHGYGMEISELPLHETAGLTA
jgi:hypothetical protein